MTFAVWEPGQALQFRAMSWAQLEDLVGGRHSAVARAGLWRAGADRHLLKLLASDVALVFPEAYPAHAEPASRFVELLGGTYQPWAGVIAVYGIDSIEGGFPEPLTGHQRELIAGAYRQATGAEPLDTTAG